MAESFQDICWEIARGFRDAVLGAGKIFKIDEAKSDKKDDPPEHHTVLAQRRAQRQKHTQREEKAQAALWILPLFVLSKIVNCFWFADIADAAYRKSRGRPQLPNVSIFIADMLFSLLIQTFFLLQGTAASFLPLPTVAQIISVLHMSLLYSLYSFEYKWINMAVFLCVSSLQW
ncbi:EI24-like protein [Mya arenaria]|uniref:EI24-like protein n=1 Tax=Mya arenaria TaxID=6604 RepID=A0ABY7E526_MYAAR|nr:EI24-like protein [Mya arenaria]